MRRYAREAQCSSGRVDIVTDVAARCLMVTVRQDVTRYIRHHIAKDCSHDDERYCPMATPYDIELRCRHELLQLTHTTDAMTSACHDKDVLPLFAPLSCRCRHCR